MQQYKLVGDRHYDGIDDHRWFAALTDVGLSRTGFRHYQQYQFAECLRTGDDFDTDTADASAASADDTASASTAASGRRLQHFVGQPIGHDDSCQQFGEHYLHIEPGGDVKLRHSDRRR